MKNLWIHSVRAYIRLGMFFYFKTIKIYGVANVPKDKPVLLLGNHQNALLDALLIAAQCGRFPYYLTRASVFKKSLVSRILKSLNMLPVYRIRDGWNKISQNTAIFETCSNLLANNEAVAMFPEGSHDLVRRVRPLSKGFTRIVFDTLEKYPKLDLQLVPVGLNFKNATHFPDSTAMYFGEAISAKSFISDNRNEDVKKLKEKIANQLSELTTNIPKDNYFEIVNRLDALQVDYLKPKEVNACIKSQFTNCKLKKKEKPQFIKAFFKILLIACIFVPYLIWRFVVKPKIKEPEFIATFRFAVVITLVPLYLIIIFCLLLFLTSILVASSYVLATILIALITVKL
jgi:1-acyl-sn-glycerol-3-phosphate acyltransferase